MTEMSLYSLDVSRAIEARFFRALHVSRSEVRTSGSGFTVTQFQDAAALYRRRAEQTFVSRERREYEALARRFAEEAENCRINGLAPGARPDSPSAKRRGICSKEERL
jgi:hypothetical protein